MSKAYSVMFQLYFLYLIHLQTFCSSQQIEIFVNNYQDVRKIDFEKSLFDRFYACMYEEFDSCWANCRYYYKPFTNKRFHKVNSVSNKDTQHSENYVYECFGFDNNKQYFIYCSTENEVPVCQDLVQCAPLNDGIFVSTNHFSMSGSGIKNCSRSCVNQTFYYRDIQTSTSTVTTTIITSTTQSSPNVITEDIRITLIIIAVCVVCILLLMICCIIAFITYMRLKIKTQQSHLNSSENSIPLVERELNDKLDEPCTSTSNDKQTTSIHESEINDGTDISKKQKYVINVKNVKIINATDTRKSGPLDDTSVDSVDKSDVDEETESDENQRFIYNLLSNFSTFYNCMLGKHVNCWANYSCNKDSNDTTILEATHIVKSEAKTNIAYLYECTYSEHLTCYIVCSTWRKINACQGFAMRSLFDIILYTINIHLTGSEIKNSSTQCSNQTIYQKVSRVQSTPESTFVYNVTTANLSSISITNQTMIAFKLQITSVLLAGVVFPCLCSFFMLYLCKIRNPRPRSSVNSKTKKQVCVSNTIQSKKEEIIPSASLDQNRITAPYLTSTPTNNPKIQSDINPLVHDTYTTVDDGNYDFYISRTIAKCEKLTELQSRMQRLDIIKAL